MTKIYTKGGDKGSTGLFDGTRVSKNHPLVNAYGTVDELNSVLGIARAWMAHFTDSETAGYARLHKMLYTIQLELFDLGADLANKPPQRINDGQVARFEQWIDELTAGLPPLSNFILPTGHPVTAALHQCRTVSRRAERMLIAASEGLGIMDEGSGKRTSAEHDPQSPVPNPQSQAVDQVFIRYLNRLADLFFVLAREANRVYGMEDELWKKQS